MAHRRKKKSTPKCPGRYTSCRTVAKRVVMLEKAPEEEFGGNARYSHTGFRDGHSNTCNWFDCPMGITANALGERFYDEGEPNHSYTYAKTGRAVLAQPGGTAHQIFDQKGIKLFRLSAEYTDTYEEAETITALAGEIGLDAEPLIATIDEFNAACSDVPSDPSPLDGKSTSGLKIKKSNWANPVDEGPFRAYPITCGVTFPFGGVRASTQGQKCSMLPTNPSRGCMCRAMWSGCSSTTTRSVRARPVTPSLAAKPAAVPRRRGIED